MHWLNGDSVCNGCINRCVHYRKRIRLTFYKGRHFKGIGACDGVLLGAVGSGVVAAVAAIAADAMIGAVGLPSQCRKCGKMPTL